MGKFDLIKGQPAYLADMSKKRKKPHELDQGGSTAGHVGKVKKPRKPRKPRDIMTIQTDSSQPWKVLNRQTLVHPVPWTTTTMQTVPTYPPSVYFTDRPVPSLGSPAIHLPTMANGLNVPGPSLPTEPLRPPKKAKISKSSTYAIARDSVCPLCGGPKHSLPDCPATKGGVEK